jgi:hypothetical protein
VFDSYGMLTKPVCFTISSLDVVRRDVAELLDPAIDVGVNGPALTGAEVEDGELAIFTIAARAWDFIAGLAHGVFGSDAAEARGIHPRDVYGGRSRICDGLVRIRAPGGRTLRLG